MTLTEHYYRQRPSRLQMLRRRIRDWWRPPIKPIISPAERERQSLLAQIRSDLMLPAPAQKN